ncbi:MAG: hypothetical protein AB8G99_15420 [Planctomycetaceae bacterium]
MQLHEYECPACNLRLRMRGPLRDRQQFKCPDCDASLHVRIDGVSCEVLLDESQVVGPANTGPNSTPQVVAWTVVGILAVGFVAFLLSGSSSSGTTDETNQADVLVEEAHQPQEPEVVPELPTAETPTTELVDAPPPVDESAGLANATAVPKEEDSLSDIMPPAPALAESPAVPQLTEAEKSAAERLAREQAAIAIVNEKLSLKLVRYSTSQTATVRTFLDEISTLASVRIDQSGLADATLNKVVNVVGEDCSIGDLLQQAGLRFEALQNGIRLY